MKQREIHPNRTGCFEHAVLLLIAAAIALALGGCCRQANEFSFQKWENKHKFEKKVSYVKYPKQKKIKINY